MRSFSNLPSEDSGLKKRGMLGAKLVTSDSHEGLKRDIKSPDLGLVAVV